MPKCFVFCTMIALLAVHVTAAQELTDEARAEALLKDVTPLIENAEAFWWKGQKDNDVIAQKEAKGLFRKALPSLREAFKLHPGHARINYYLGRAALESGDAETAVMAFERVLMLEPDNPRVKLELARSYQELKVWEMAKNYFEEVRTIVPDARVRNHIDSELSLIDKEIKKATKCHFLDGVLTLGLVWDSNVEVSPENSNVQTVLVADPIPVGEETSDVMLSTVLAVKHRYQKPGSKYNWRTDLMNYNAFYRHENHLDIQYVNLASGPGIQTKRLTLAVQGVLDGLDKEYDPYGRAAGAQLRSAFAADRNLLLMLDATALQKEYKQTASRDALYLSLSTGLMWSFGANRVTAKCGVDFEDASDGDNSDGSMPEEDVHSYLKLHGWVQYNRRLSHGFGFYGKYRFQYYDYDAEDPAFNDYRDDYVHEITAGFTKKLWENFEAEINYTFTKARSSIELYQYERHMTSATLSYRF